MVRSMRGLEGPINIRHFTGLRTRRTSMPGDWDSVKPTVVPMAEMMIIGMLGHGPRDRRGRSQGETIVARPHLVWSARIEIQL